MESLNPVGLGDSLGLISCGITMSYHSQSDSVVLVIVGIDKMVHHILSRTTIFHDVSDQLSTSKSAREHDIIWFWFNLPHDVSVTTDGASTDG